MMEILLIMMAAPPNATLKKGLLAVVVVPQKLIPAMKFVVMVKIWALLYLNAMMVIQIVEMAVLRTAL